MKQFCLLFAAISTILLLASWGKKGHRAIGSIAYNHLNPNAKAAVDAILGEGNIVDLSDWADEIKNEPEYKNTASWHFLDLPSGLNHEQFLQVVKSQKKENVYSAILKCEHVLEDGSSKYEQKLVALKFLIHLVGDAHQPMHTGRAEDKGGEKIRVLFDGKDTNLHSLWDSKLIDHERLRNLGETDSHYDIASSLQIQQWQNSDPMQWVWESYQLSGQLYADAGRNSNFDERYYQKYIPVVHQRIDQAAIRLAGVLNRIFKDTKIKPPKAMPAAPPPPVDEVNIPKVFEVKDAKNLIGKKVTMTGKVFGHKTFKGMALLDLGAPYPHQLLTIVLKGEPSNFYKDIDGKTISVNGTIVNHNGTPEILVTDLNQFLVRPTTTPKTNK